MLGARNNPDVYGPIVFRNWTSAYERIKSTIR
ncbi:conserved hypothetical protein [Culex quinquefasciatus]|uniref:Uncharacterized protein n=1 Tax=Culex quinquefasciatus TaxID=7176 RepID=B0WVD5_CULQU|nr:conserved hypothetical protein [Culex quinquefasciatus]|eukprot:XP_001861357.1 conserved hypothetical protein [Culex quinquefasciatus]